MENYAIEWNNIELKPGSYKFGERRLHQMVEFITKVKFSTQAWEFWMEKLSSTDKVERRFIQYLLKYKTLVRRVTIMNSITAQIEESADQINSQIINK